MTQLGRFAPLEISQAGLAGAGVSALSPVDAACCAGVIFFNNVGYLGMCGHGLIGVVSTLQYLGKHNSGQCTIETPVGNVEAKLHRNGGVEFDNVPSFRKAKDVIVQVPELGAVRGARSVDPIPLMVTNRRVFPRDFLSKYILASRIGQA